MASRASIEELGVEIAGSMENTLEAGSFSVTLPADVKATLKTIEKSFESQDIQDVLSAMSKLEKIVETFGIDIGEYNEKLGKSFATYTREKNRAEKDIEELKKKNILADMKFRTKDGQRTMVAAILTNKQIEKQKVNLKDEFITLEKEEKDNKADIKLYKNQERSSKKGEELLKDESALRDKREELTKRQEQLTTTEEKAEDGGIRGPDLTSGPLGAFFETLLAPFMVILDVANKIFQVGRFMFDIGKKAWFWGKKMFLGFMSLAKFMLHPILMFKALGKWLKIVVLGFRLIVMTVIRGLMLAIGAVIGALIGLTWPIWLGIAAVIALGLVIWRCWDDIKEFGRKIKDVAVSVKDWVMNTLSEIWNWIKNSWLGRLVGADKTPEEKKSKELDKTNAEIERLQTAKQTGTVEKDWKKGILFDRKFRESDDKKLWDLRKKRGDLEKEVGEDVKKASDEGKKQMEDQLKEKEGVIETEKFNQKILQEEAKLKKQQVDDIKKGVEAGQAGAANMPIFNQSTTNNQTVGSSTVSIPAVIRNAEESFNRAAGHDV